MLSYLKNVQILAIFDLIPSVIFFEYKEVSYYSQYGSYVTSIHHQLHYYQIKHFSLLGTLWTLSNNYVVETEHFEMIFIVMKFYLMSSIYICPLHVLGKLVTFLLLLVLL